jgi:hypothetical protein
MHLAFPKPGGRARIIVVDGAYQIQYLPPTLVFGRAALSPRWKSSSMASKIADPYPHHYPTPNPKPIWEVKHPKGKGSRHPPHPIPRRPAPTQSPSQTDQNLLATFEIGSNH